MNISNSGGTKDCDDNRKIVTGLATSILTIFWTRAFSRATEIGFSRSAKWASRITKK